MLTITLEELHLELRYTWKIARNASDFKTNFVVKISDGTFEGMGEVAPNVRYDETPENIRKDFARFLVSKPAGISSLTDLSKLLNLVKPHYALRFAIESAYVHYLSKKSGKSVASILNVPEVTNAGTCYTLPIMDEGKLQGFFEEHRLQRFPYIKLKVNKSNAIAALDELLTFCKQPIMIDGNESWQDVEEQIIFQESIAHIKQISFIEQPLPAALTEEYKHLKKHARFDIFADESVTSSADMSQIVEQFHGVNMKLMKAGGYFKGIEILTNAKNAGLKTMIGCMVETSLGISSALRLTGLCDYADLDGFFILKDEPFALAQEKNGQLCFIQ